MIIQIVRNKRVREIGGRSGCKAVVKCRKRQPTGSNNKAARGRVVCVDEYLQRLASRGCAECISRQCSVCRSTIEVSSEAIVTYIDLIVVDTPNHVVAVRPDIASLEGSIAPEFALPPEAHLLDASDFDIRVDRKDG